MFTALLLACSLAQPAQIPGGAPVAKPARQAAPPRLAIEPKGRVNLGSVGPTEVRLQSYTFTNTSDRPIALRVLDLSPGVTVEGPALKGPIDPKGRAQLTLRVDPTDFVGWQPRNVKLGTDDPGQGEYFLPVGMNVRADLTVDGLKKGFGEVGPHESPQVVFSFRRETGQATKLWVSSPLPPYLQAEVEPVPALASPQDPATPAERRGSLGALRLTLRPSRIAPGMLAGLETLTVETSAPHQPKFQLYLDWKLRLPVQLSRARLVFLDAATRSLDLVLEGRDGKPVALAAARIEGEGFELAALPPTPAPRVVLTVHRRATAAARAMLVLQLSGEAEPIRVPLSYVPAGEPAPPQR